MLELYKSKSKIVGMTKEHSILQYVLFFFSIARVHVGSQLWWTWWNVNIDSM